MDLRDITFKGPEFDGSHPLAGRLPDDLVDLLRQINGFVQFGGGLHVRGLCEDPAWHSLALVMDGPLALHAHYPEVRDSDVPFAQDCVADQFLLRGKEVLRLAAETGDLEPLGMDLGSFLAEAGRNPVEFLAMHPLLQARREGQDLAPGQVLHVYPPFCTKESVDGVSLRPVSCTEALDFLTNFARQIRDFEDGDHITFEITD